MDLTTAVDELYGVAPGDFIAVRTRLVADAKADDDPEVAAELKALRKPTVVAWLLNRVARREPEVITGLTDLGGRMRTAQAKGDGAALAEARPERDERKAALVEATRRQADEHGQTFGQSAIDQVSSTAVAVLADETSARVLTAGRLLRALTYAGFGEVELDDAVAVPLRLVPRLEASSTHEEDEDGSDEEDDERAEALAAARDELRELERSLGAARLARSEAAVALETASARVTDLEDQVAHAERAVAELSPDES